MTVAGGGGVSGSKSPAKIMANIFISFIGAGVLGLPFAFKEVSYAKQIPRRVLVLLTTVITSYACLLVYLHMYCNKHLLEYYYHIPDRHL